MSLRKKRIIHAVKDEPYQQSSAVKPASQPSNLLVVLLILVSFFAGYLFFKVKNLEQGKGVVQNVPQQPPRPTELKVKKPEANDHWRGNKDVKFAWIEYSDLECPYCKKIHPDLLKLMKDYEGKVTWIYRHYPLPFHPKAQKTAEATECAGELGGNDAFWKMTDAIFEKMPGLELTDLPVLASEIGLNEAAFKQCLDSGKYEKNVKDQLAEGSKASVQATPTNIIYNLKTGKTLLVEGALPYESLKQSLDEFMRK